MNNQLAWWLRVSSIRQTWLRRIAIILTFPFATLVLLTLTMFIALLAAPLAAIGIFLDLWWRSVRHFVVLFGSALFQWRHKQDERDGV